MLNKLKLAFGILLFSLFIYSAAIPATASAATKTCEKKQFLGLKPWYEYLEVTQDPLDPNACKVNISSIDDESNQNRFNGILVIGLVILEDLLRIAGLVAVGFVIYGGIQYITSQGESERTKQALSSIINALIGLAIAIVGATLISFIARRLGA